MMTTQVLPDFVTKDLRVQDPPRFTVVSTFAGCGGSSTGYVWAGGKVLLAVEWDDNAVQTYKLNYPDTPVYHGDIAKLSVEEALRLTGLQRGELDIFDGSPPCQGFSTAGKRDFGDDRNQLFREYVRLLCGFMPKVFVMENVSGMVKGKMKLIFVDILRELKASGYKVSARLLNAKYFGVPQSRERMIFIGVRDDLGIEPTHPKAQTRPITVREATADSEVVQNAPVWREYNRKLWLRMKPGDNGVNGTAFNHCRIHPDHSSPTIPKSAVFGGFSGLYHWSEPRSLHIGELRRIGSFPDQYRFIGGYEASLNRIGNSVPPMFMYHIAAHIRDNILTRTEAADG